MEKITKDEKRINQKYVSKKIDKKECISSILEYYGYTLKFVTSYEEAINELCKKNSKNKCEYNSLWVLSGEEIHDLKSKNGDISAHYYAEQLVDYVLQFWKNGGSLVLMGEKDPYNFQLNLFLKKLEFPDGKKLKFKIGGNHKGGKILTGDYSGKFKKETFNKEIFEVNNLERNSLGNNLLKIFEGVNLAYSIGDINPFIPFCIDS